MSPLSLASVVAAAGALDLAVGYATTRLNTANLVITIAGLAALAVVIPVALL